MDKVKVITELGNIIMRCTPCVIEKKDKDILFEAYKLLGDYYHEECWRNKERVDSGWKNFAKAMAEKKEEIDYQHWKDDYCNQMLWFYETLGLRDVHVDGDFLCVDPNGIFGYNLRKMYEQFKASDDEQ